MPDSPAPDAGGAVPAGGLDTVTADAAELAAGAARAALGVPGVARLEPTLRSALRRLQATTHRWRSQPGAATAAADGVVIRRRGQVVDVHVDITVSPVRPAHLTAYETQQALRSHVIGERLVPGTITVAVLSVERGPHQRGPHRRGR